LRRMTIIRLLSSVSIVLEIWCRWRHVVRLLLNLSLEGLSIRSISLQMGSRSSSWLIRHIRIFELLILYWLIIWSWLPLLNLLLLMKRQTLILVALLVLLFRSSRSNMGELIFVFSHRLLLLLLNFCYYRFDPSLMSGSYYLLPSSSQE